MSQFLKVAQNMAKTAEQKYSRWLPHASKPGKFSILTNSSSLKRILWTSFAELRMDLKQMWQPLKNTRTNWTQPLNKRKTKTAKFKSNIANLKSRIFNLPPFITTYFLKKLMSFYFISSFFQITPDFFQTGQLAQTKPQTDQLATGFILTLPLSVKSSKFHYLTCFWNSGIYSCN